MMQKLTLHETIETIENVLRHQDLPALTTLRQVSAPEFPAVA